VAQAGAAGEVPLPLGAMRGAAGEPWGEASPSQPTFPSQKEVALAVPQQLVVQSLQVLQISNRYKEVSNAKGRNHYDS